MDAKIPCPECGARLKLPAAAAGRSVRCPSCKMSFVAPPAAAPAAGDFEVLDDDPAEPPAGGSPGPNDLPGAYGVQDEPVPAAPKGRKIVVVDDGDMTAPSGRSAGPGGGGGTTTTTRAAGDSGTT